MIFSSFIFKTVAGEKHFECTGQADNKALIITLIFP